LAVSVRCEPRFTRDIDLAVAVADDSAAEGLVTGLVAAGYRLRLSLEHDVLRRLAAVRLTPPDESDEGVVLDLLFASSGIEDDICRDAEWLELADGVMVPVARAGHLVATKLLAIGPDRPQDGVDLQALKTRLTVEERARARAAVARIEQIGAQRDKQLTSDFVRWLDPPQTARGE
jgi:predicted nucleotidyltransferase